MFGGHENPGGEDIHSVPCISIREEERFIHDENGMVEDKTPCCSSPTSLGENSDTSGVCFYDHSVPQDTEEEAQSSYESALDDSMQASEDVLPTRKGISKFHKGKLKSFASLADAASSKELTKPDNVYARKLGRDKSRSKSSLGISSGAIAKRSHNSSSSKDLEANSSSESLCSVVPPHPHDPQLREVREKESNGSAFKRGN